MYYKFEKLFKAMKTEMKFTKGKWIVYPGSESCNYPGIDAVSKEHGNVSIICMGDDLEGVQGRTKEEIMANAKLIAVAPELLDACIDTLRILQLKPTNDNLYQRNKLKALIQKATK